MPINNQDRSKQPTRANGGNSDMNQIEKHDQPKASQLAIGGSMGSKKPGQGFDCGGNASCGESVEKHDQTKMRGKRYRGGVEVGAVPELDSNIEVCGRDYDCGNSAEGKHEAQGQKKARTIDMSPKARF